MQLFSRSFKGSCASQNPAACSLPPISIDLSPYGIPVPVAPARLWNPHTLLACNVAVPHGQGESQLLVQITRVTDWYGTETSGTRCDDKGGTSTCEVYFNVHLASTQGQSMVGSRGEVRLRG